MHIQNCEHPKKIYHPITGDPMYVPCGKCDMCKVNRANVWIQKIQDECSCHRFTFCINLDYDDLNIPRFDIVGDFLFEQNPRFTKGRFEWSDVCIPLNELKFDNKYDFDYFVDRVNCHHLGLPHCSVSDIQNFKKRLNKYLRDHVTGQYRNFRSAIVSEYGPTTYRPHYHGILWFDDIRIAEALEVALSHAWPYGHCLSEPDAGTFGSYIASYINRPSYLPSVYSHSALRPLFLFSKHPPLGSLLESSKEIREIFFNGSVERVRRVKQQGKIENLLVPLSPSLKNRLFPKCPFFGGISDSLRVALYRLPLQENGEPFLTFKDFVNHIDGRFFDYWFLDTPSAPWPDDLPFPLQGLPCRNERCDIDLLKVVKRISSDFSKSAGLKSLYRIARRIYSQSKIFGVSYDFYISRIIKYYQNVELQKIKVFYGFQESYSRTHSVDDLGFMYPERIEFINRICRNYGLSDVHLDIMRDCKSFHNLVVDNRIKYDESHKTMRKNAYFRKLRWKDPVLFNILKKYDYAKKCNEVT